VHGTQGINGLLYPRFCSNRHLSQAWPSAADRWGPAPGEPAWRGLA
jgi:hypothetical protein